MAELPVKARVGIEMLAEAREGDFGAAHAVLLKLLGNIVAHPDELKYRRLRTTNAKIAALLQTRGVRALLIGLGFVEEGADSLVLPEAASTSVVQTGLTALDALAVRTFAFVATFIPRKPASAEQIAPTTNESATKPSLSGFLLPLQ